MKTIAFTIFALLLAVAAQAGVTEDQYNSIMELIQTKKYDSAFADIQEIKAADSTDPEYYSLSINYYYLKSYREWVEIVPDFPVGVDSALIVTDSTGQTVGYMQNHIGYDLDTLGVGVQILREGLALHPDRLDMRFGLVHVAQSAELYEVMADELIEILERRIENGDNWFWSFSAPLVEEAEAFILENIQVRASMLFELNNPTADSLAKLLSEALVQHFPTSPYGHANLGALYAARQKHDRSLAHFMKALELAPTDAIVISNIARIHENAGQVDKAIEYYNLLLEVGAPKEQDYAKQQLDRLKQQ